MSRPSILLLFAGFLAACSADETLPRLDFDDTPEAAPLAQRAGALLAEYRFPRAGREEGLTVHAQFLDMRGVSLDTALEALEVWLPDHRLDPASCSLRLPSQAPTDAARIRLDLLDVGPIAVESPEHLVRLDARRLPDLLSAFSGVIYGTEQLHIPYEPLAHYRFSAPGHGATGGFTVELPAPEPLQMLRVAHTDLGAAAEDGPQAVHLAADRDLEIVWLPSSSDAGADVFIDVTAGVGPDRPRLKCRADDEGYFTIPASALEQLTDELEALEVSMRRVYASDVSIQGLDASQFIIATTDEVMVVID